MADLKILGVSKSFENTKAIKNLNIDISSGEFIVLLGPSGAGKTTTLRLVAGLETPDCGQVFIDGKDVTKVAPALRDVTFVFQQYSLYPHMSVYDNLAFPLRSPLRKTSETDIKRIVNEVARLLRMEDKLQNPATKLSGGQMQRVAIGRALVRNPAIYLMDEPLSSLDAKLRNDLRLELKHIQQDLGATMLYVTHDQVEALTLASRIGVLDHGELVQLGTPQQVYEDPVSVNVASRLGSPRINIVSCSVFPNIAVPEEVTTLGIRAEHIRLQKVYEPSLSQSQCQVKRIERLSDQYLVHLGVVGSEHDVIASVSPGIHFEPGDVVGASMSQILWFDVMGQRVK
jgi:multiple sugar transport system ATP-binding protein